MLVTVGYFVLFASARAAGGIRTFGRVLSIWIFVIALFPPMAGAYLALSGQCPIEQVIKDLGQRGTP